MTRLIASVQVNDPDGAAAQVERAMAAGADAVELRIDGYEGDVEPLRRLMAARRTLTWVVTCRSAEEGGRFTADTAQRVARLIEAARQSGAWVDFEWSDWQRSANIRQKVLLASADPATGEARLILSHHRFDAPIADAPALAAEMAAGVSARVMKLAWMPRDITDNLQAFDLLRAAQQGGQARDVVPICMGEEGLPSRVLGRKFGAWATYASIDAASRTAPGQLTLQQLHESYRWETLGPDTHWYGVVGDPVAHSMSPALFNRLFAEDAINAVYLPLWTRGEDAFPRFLDGVRQRPWLDLAGLSVTLPHKEAALRLADKVADSTAHAVGAANTLVVRDGRIHAFNTDAPAIAESLLAALEPLQIPLEGLPVDVLGTGGAARAVLAALRPLGCQVTVYGRDEERTGRLADEFAAGSGPWSQRGHGRGAVLINATSVGMWPDVHESPLEDLSLAGRTLVFDLVYNPPATRLLIAAQAAGVATLSGLDMFVRQAAAQYALWTGRRTDLERIRGWVNEAMGAGTGLRTENAP